MKILPAFIALSVTACSVPANIANRPPDKPLDAVPKLNIVVDCGGCAITANTPAIIRQTYSDEAAYAGAKVLPDTEAVLTIKEYKARHPGVRVLLGMLSGQDRITAVLIYRGRQIVVEEHAVGAVGTIDDVAGRIGRSAFNELAAIH